MRRGAVTIQMIVILGTVLLALMGFAVDLGRIYLIKGELQTAANAMALTAAQQLIGTEASTEAAAGAARLAASSEGNVGNRYDFSGLQIGQANGNLLSEIPDPTFYDSASAAIGEGDNIQGGEASGATAKHVRVRINADAPLVFWGLLAQGQERKTPMVTVATAGVSAPLCTACGIENVALQAVDAADTADFGFIKDIRYTLAYSCTGQPQPNLLPGTSTRVSYLLLDRNNTSASIFTDETSQLYRIGAAGLPPSTTNTQACFAVNSVEALWASATPLACNQNRVQTSVTNFLCGLASRFDTAPATNCQNIAEIDSLQTIHPVDTDLTELDTYASYTGNLRRVISVPIVDTLSAQGNMTVLGFRQFLVEPNQGEATLAAGDQSGRFPALYIGSVVPLKQGRFGDCQISSGPGKVVLHR